MLLKQGPVAENGLEDHRQRGDGEHNGGLCMKLGGPAAQAGPLGTNAGGQTATHARRETGQRKE